MTFILCVCVLIQIFRQIHCPPPQRAKIEKPKVAPKPKDVAPKLHREPFVGEEQIKAKLESLKRVSTDKSKIPSPKPQRESYTEEQQFEGIPKMLKPMDASLDLFSQKQRKSFVEELPTQTKLESQKDTGAFGSFVDTPQRLSYTEHFQIGKEHESVKRRISPQTRRLVAEPEPESYFEKQPKVQLRRGNRMEEKRRSVDILQPEPYIEREQNKEKRKSLHEMTSPKTELLVGEPELQYYTEQHLREQLKKLQTGATPTKPKRLVSTAEPQAYSEEQKREEKRKLLDRMGLEVHNIYNEYVRKNKNLQQNTDVEEKAVWSEYRQNLELLRSNNPERNPEDYKEYLLREAKLNKHMTRELDLVKATYKQALDELKAEMELRINKLAQKIAEEINHYNQKFNIVSYQRRAQILAKDIQHEISKRFEFDANWPNTEHVQSAYEGLMKAAETYTPADTDLYAKNEEGLLKILLSWLLENIDVENPTFGHYPCSAEQFHRSLLEPCILIRSAMDLLTKYEKESIIRRYPYQK